MSDFTLLMRYKDLGTDNAISALEKIICNHGYAWGGWWAKPEESLPIEAMRELRTQKNIRMLLLDTDRKAVFPAKVTSLVFSEENREICSPEKEATPSYYSDNMLLLWFRIENIEPPSYNSEIVRNYSYADFDSFRTVDDEAYRYYDNTYVMSIDQLVSQRRTLILLRKQKRTDSPAIHEVVKKPRVSFSDSYAVTESNSILLMSDMHFSDDPQKFAFKDGKSPKIKSLDMLSEAVRNLTGEQHFASLFCAGDLTNCSSVQEFKRAEQFIFSAVNNHRIDKDNLIIVPGNHDIKFSTETFEEIPYATDASKQAYSDFYKKIYSIEPNEFFAVGRKLLLKNRLPIEVVGLNSNCLQQEQSHFYGMGFIGEEQLNMVKRCMGWDEKSNQTYAFRILVLHHHLFPIEFIQEPERDYLYSLCLDAGALIDFIINNRIDLIIHGHKHKHSFMQITQSNGNQEKDYTFSVLSLGSSGFKDIGDNPERNSIGILDFEEFGKVKIRILELKGKNQKACKDYILQKTLPISRHNE